MENDIDLPASLNAIKNVVDNTSWFRGDPHRWATASLPLAYAVACVEVVSKKSAKAGAIYQQIIEAWGKPGINAIYEAIIAEVPESEIEKVKNALVHPEAELFPDPNRPFKQLGEMFTGLEIDPDLFKDDDTEQLSVEDQRDAEEFVALMCLILEFIVVGFNRESDINGCDFTGAMVEKTNVEITEQQKQQVNGLKFDKKAQ